MGTILDAFTFKFLTKLGQVIENEDVMTLSVTKDIKRLKNNLEHFSAIREDAEAMAMEDKRIGAWWKNMSNVMFDVDVIIDLVMVHSEKLLLTPRSVCCNQSMISCIGKLSFDHRVARRIKDINEKLDEVKMNTEMFNLDRTTRQQFQVTIVDRKQTSPVDELEVVGTEIKHAVEDMVEMIVSSCRENRSSVSGIQAMGGIGKTTLAQKIYNEPLVREKFQVRIWLCVSQSYTETGLIKQAIRMAGEKCDQLETKTELLPLLVESIKGKSVFLVLDDVWKSDVWIDLLLSPFMRALNFHVVVTTRNLDVLAEMHATYIHRVNTMNCHDGLELLMKKSFQPHEQISEFKNVGYEIVKKCDGLPLAIKVVAGVLSTKRTTAEWKSIRDSKWSIHGLPKELGGPLYLSCSNLPHQLKECFLWCALLPPNFEIHHDAVAYWWVAEGLVRKEHGFSIHEIAEEYYLELVRRNLLQPVPEYVDKAVSTMHDLLRSLGQYLTKDHSLCMNVGRIGAMSNLRRLAISHVVEEIPTLEEHKCLRSLLLFNNKNFKSMHRDVFRKLEHIRVLVLSGTSIKDIPDSLGNLVLLRLLDLSYTEINKLPESTGSLISLEYLSLLGCRQLDSLPVGLMRLPKISFLHLEQTSIDHVPKGIAKFQQLYNLRGVSESGTGFRLDELRCLPNIERLWVSKLEEAIPGGELVLKNSRNLKELGLRCTMNSDPHDRTCYAHDKVHKIQQVYDMLIPSPSLECIFLLNMPSLRQMHLDECVSCSELPPAGQMPQLQFLKIKGADAIESIGKELLGKEVGSPAAFFPKLEVLQVIGMFSLRSWSLNTGNPSDNSQHISPMPCLKRLLLLDCPKLRALPHDMSKIVNLKRIHIEGAHKLQEVVDLPAVVWLKVKNNTCLKTISNLCKLQDLLAQECPALDQAKNLCSLRRLYMVDCPHDQEFRKCLPEEGVLVHVATIGADGRNIFSDESLYN
nr:NBS-LRR disease resistance protein [Dasypyrum villosum]